MSCSCNHQFWFIKYRWRRRPTDKWNHENILIGEHPLHWLASTYNHEERYSLDFFYPVNADFYEKYKEKFD